MGVSSSAKADASRTREDRIRTDGSAAARKLLVAEHPAVRTHPETGRKALYVNRAHTVGFAGMTEEESAPLLEYLFRHQIRPEFTCRFRWTAGALAIWDNRCAQHYAVNDYAGRRRVMQRITLAGDRAQLASGYSSPSWWKLSHRPLPTMTWSCRTMDSASAAALICWVIAMSSREGVGSPLG